MHPTADPVPALDTFNLDAIEGHAMHAKSHADMMATNINRIPPWRTLAEKELADAKASLLRVVALIEEAEARFGRKS